MHFCTLFDSNYLDKGLVLIDSLTEVTGDCEIYVLPMDERCHEILDSMKLPRVTVIPLDEFVPCCGLSQIRRSRSAGEFCWTCTPFLIGYVLKHFGVDRCTYVDADLCFYQDPGPLLDEMGERSVQIIRHGFSGRLEDRIDEMISGTYCVQFNTFRNEADSLALLGWWQQKCKSFCGIDQDAGVFGDQKYLQGWERKPCVSVLSHPGAGVAPWNIGQYRLAVDAKKPATDASKSAVDARETAADTRKTAADLVSDCDQPMLMKDGKVFPLMFYHFHKLTYLDEKRVGISVYSRFWNVDDRLVRCIYLPYLRRLEEKKRYLKDHFDFCPMLYSHPVLAKQEKKGQEKTAQGRNAIEKGIGSRLLKLAGKLRRRGLKYCGGVIFSRINSGLRRKLNGAKDVLEI